MMLQHHQHIRQAAFEQFGVKDYENVRAMTAKSIAEQDTIFLPWRKGDAIFPLAGAEDVGRVATAPLQTMAHLLRMQTISLQNCRR